MGMILTHVGASITHTGCVFSVFGDKTLSSLKPKILLPNICFVPSVFHFLGINLPFYINQRDNSTSLL